MLIQEELRDFLKNDDLELFDRQLIQAVLNGNEHLVGCALAAGADVYLQIKGNYRLIDYVLDNYEGTNIAQLFIDFLPPEDNFQGTAPQEEPDQQMDLYVNGEDTYYD